MDGPPNQQPEGLVIREVGQNHVFARPSISWGKDAPGNL
jgi:hypothetical protein